MERAKQVTVMFDEGLWAQEVKASFGSKIGQEYLDAMLRECLTVRQLSRSSSEDLRELGIRLGHRQQLTDLADDFVIQMTKRATTAERRRRRDRLLREVGGSASDLRLSLEATLRFSSSWYNRPNTGVDKHGQHQNSSLVIETLRNDEDVEWVRVEGSAPTLEAFLTEMNNLLRCWGFPSEEFHRLFYDNKPMPFSEFATSATGGDLVAFLLRIPDVTATEGTSVTVITNRVVVLMSLDENLIMTYQRCPNTEHGVSTFHEEWIRGTFAHADLGAVLETMLRKVLRAYEVAVTALREAMDHAMHMVDDEVSAVRHLTLIMKKASIFKRCATASRTALQDIQEKDGFELLQRHMRVLCDRLKTVESLCEEMEQNALSSVDLNIALAEFRSSTNLKIFTYITVVAQPIAMATGWYGMNFSNMPELLDDNAYFIFAAVVLLSAFALLFFVLWREKKLLRVGLDKLPMLAPQKPIVPSPQSPVYSQQRPSQVVHNPPVGPYAASPALASILTPRGDGHGGARTSRKKKIVDDDPEDGFSLKSDERARHVNANDEGLTESALRDRRGFASALHPPSASKEEDLQGWLQSVST